VEEIAEGLGGGGGEGVKPAGQGHGGIAEEKGRLERAIGKLPEGIFEEGGFQGGAADELDDAFGNETAPGEDGFAGKIAGRIEAARDMVGDAGNAGGVGKGVPAPAEADDVAVGEPFAVVPAVEAGKGGADLVAGKAGVAVEVFAESLIIHFRSA